MANNNQCEYDLNVNNHYSELYSVNYNRLTESQVIDKWYESVYTYDFEKKKFRIKGINFYPMINILYDTTKQVGCARVCCAMAELYICDFFPVVEIIEGFEEHIKRNKYLK